MGENIIPILIIVIVVGLAVTYIVKQKKAGKKCIGCPDSSTCSGKCAGCGCGCKFQETKEE